MRFTPLVAIVCFACGHASSDDEADRKKPRVDAAPSSTEDAPPPTDLAKTSVVSCDVQAAPSNTCTSPSYCCFNNYSADHNGYCTTTDSCFGNIRCDGPEDCSSGQRCCATGQYDPDFGVTHYEVACRASCDGPPIDYELCHPTSVTTCATGSCVTAYGTATDLPRSLYVCN